MVSEATEKTVPEGGWVFSADAELEYTEPHFVEHTVINAREDKFTGEAISKTPKPTGGEMSLVVRETGFDERLLSDLIQAYGEFSPVLKSSSSTTQPRAGEIESRGKSDSLLPDARRHGSGDFERAGIDPRRFCRAGSSSSTRGTASQLE